MGFARTGGGHTSWNAGFSLASFSGVEPADVNGLSHRPMDESWAMEIQNPKTKIHGPKKHRPIGLRGAGMDGSRMDESCMVGCEVRPLRCPQGQPPQRGRPHMTRACDSSIESGLLTNQRPTSASNARRDGPHGASGAETGHTEPGAGKGESAGLTGQPKLPYLGEGHRRHRRPWSARCRRRPPR